MKRLLREPILHFLLLGGMLFIAQQQWAVHVSPQVIEVSEAERARLQHEWLARTGRMPTPAEADALVHKHVNDELLFQEAKRLGLHETDPVVHQRLIRNMRFAEQDSDSAETKLIDAALALGMLDRDLVIRRRLIQRMQHRLESQVHITEADASTYYRDHPEEFQTPAGFSIRQLFFSHQREGEPADKAARDALLKLNAGSDASGDPFLLGTSFRQITASELGKILGQDIAIATENASVMQWIGPVASVYGMHLIQVEDIRPPRLLDYATVRPRIVAKLYADHEAIHLQETLAKLRTRYSIRVTGSAAGDSA